MYKLNIDFQLDFNTTSIKNVALRLRILHDLPILKFSKRREGTTIDQGLQYKAPEDLPVKGAYKEKSRIVEVIIY